MGRKNAEIYFKKYVYRFDNRNLKCYNLPIFLRETKAMAKRFETAFFFSYYYFFTKE